MECFIHLKVGSTALQLGVYMTDVVLNISKLKSFQQQP